MGQNDVGESEQPSGSDVGQSIASTNMTEEDINSMVNNVMQRVKPIVITIVQQSIPEDVLRRIIKEEVQSFGKKGLAGESRNEVPKERILDMRFVNEVSGPVMTSDELKGIRGDPLEVALFDATETTEHIVNSGPESSAKVEIVLIDASDDDENIITREKFEGRIIKAGDKKKPYLSGNVYISLKRGVGRLIGLKLGHGKEWTNFCYCRLGVRLVQNFKGVTAQEGWTKPFKVKDKRGKQYDKHYPPFPSDDVWRLKKIARNGEPCNRLYKKNIKTVEDFMFWQNVNHEELQEKILQVGDSTWKTIVDHACSCTMDEEKMYSHKCPEAQMSVIYDGVGKLKGVIYESRFIRTDNLSADKKDNAHKLLSSVLDPSAFVKRYNTPFNDEEFRLQQQSDINDSAICSIRPCSNRNDLTRSEYINLHQTTGPGSTSPSIIPNSNSYSGPSDSLGTRDTGELCDPPSALFENFDGDSPTDLDIHDCDTGRLIIYVGDPAFALDGLDTPDRGGGSCEVEGEWSSTYSESSFLLTGSLKSTSNSSDPMTLDYSGTTQMHNQTNESNVYVDQTAAIAPVNTSKLPKRWKRLFCVVTLYSISKRVSDVTPKQKRQKLG